MGIIFYLILSVRVTVYNSNLALVKDTRDFNFKQGRQTIDFKEVASYIDPTSVSFNSPDVEILEQNYRYDLVNTAKLLEKYIDHDITIVLKDGKLEEGKLLTSDEKNIIILTSTGIKILRLEEVVHTGLPELPEGLITKPTLNWLVNAKSSGEKKCEVSYLTDNINWHAEYIGTLKNDEMDFSGWVTVDNKSGVTYKDAKLKLVAGDVHRATSEARNYGGKAEFAAYGTAAPRVEEREFFEYHIYELKDQTTIRNREEKQIIFVPQTTVKTKTVYVFDNNRYGSKSIEVKLEFKNSEQDGLGIPLPKGKVRIYKEDKDRSLEFAGEDWVSHTPKDEKVSLYIGNAFDLAGERKMLKESRITDRTTEKEIEITLRNHKKSAVNIKVVEHISGEWKILSNSHKWEQKDASTIEFYPSVDPNSEIKVNYKVRTSW
ncbi:MAG: DUF4139 domain-containing protein [bacterium]|nr:DUF4139 domain-containing protein [bacterium]